MNMSITERVVRRQYQQYVMERDRVLLDLVFNSALTQKELDEAMEVCDIDVLGAAKSLMLSYIMRDFPEFKFPDYAAPRLRGLIDYFRFANIRVLSHFSKIGKALNAAGIPVLIFKGGAMKILRPELCRPMGDVDVLVPP
ncbi:MAG: nucleotidyltransferase family protein, partial [Deltaproteobacteria bacterium]|nr:nucleotidyltransferase family protein [Deltaproteobacteria bacterium]